jgi:ParB family chromosome partitioning protein
MPEALRRDLEAYRLQAAQFEIARHPAIAFDLLVFTVACGVFSHDRPYDGVDVHFRESHTRPSVERDTPAAALLEGHRASFLPLDWLEEGTEAARFEAFRSLPDDDKHHLLAYCTALTLKPRLAPAAGERLTAYDLALARTGGDLAGYWRPTKANYLSRVTRDQLLALGRETLGDPWAQSRAREKKGELADQLDRAFADPAQPGRSPAQAEKLKRGLPEGMAFGLPESSEPAEADTAREAA